MNVVGADHDIKVSNSVPESTSGKKTKSTGSQFRFSNRKAQDTYLHTLVEKSLLAAVKKCPIAAE